MGKPIRASQTTQLSQAVVATSFPPRSTRTSGEVLRFLEVIGHCRATRRTGSSALNLCSVAAGRFDAFWSYDTKPWDVAAGALIVARLRGCLPVWRPGIPGSRSQLPGRRYPPLHQELCRVLAAVTESA